MSEMVDVEVLMTVYNGGAYVAETIGSLQSQTLQGFRLQVVDDGSNDDTPAILGRLAAADPRIRVHRKPNGGVVEASNHGLQFCTAEFVARLDADDLCYPDRLERQVGYLRDHPDVLAVAGKARHIDPAGRRLGTVAKFPPPERADAEHIPAVEPYLLHPFVTLRRSALERVGGYRELSVSEDSDLYWRLQELGPLHNDDHFCGEYRMNPESLSSRSVRNGRVMAVFSQLAALSARRRRSARPDLAFTRAYADAIKAASGSLDGTCAAAAVQLEPAEVERFRFAVGVKLMEMAGYRPYELELSDCAFLREVLPAGVATLRGTNRGIVRRNFSGTAARLAAKGLWAEARALTASGFGPAFWMRYGLRKLMPSAFHRRVRVLVGPVLRLIRGG